MVEPERGKGLEEGGGSCLPSGQASHRLWDSPGPLDQPSQEVAAAAAVLLLSQFGAEGAQPLGHGGF